MVKKVGMIFLIAIVTFGFDFIWLNLVAKNFYLTQMQSLLLLDDQGSIQYRPVPAILVYFVFGIAQYWFVLNSVSSLKSACMNGAVLGFSIYGVYDLTNMATLKTWAPILTIVDILWGTVLCAVVAGVVVKILKKA